MELFLMFLTGSLSKLLLDLARYDQHFVSDGRIYN